MKESQDIAIIGMAGKFPQADNLDEFWDNLITGKNSVSDFPESRIQELARVEEVFQAKTGNNFLKMGYLSQIALFDPAYFNISAAECLYMDPQLRLLLELVDTAIQDAGYTLAKISSQKVGVFMAHSKNEYSAFLKLAPMKLVNSAEASLSGRISYTFNFTGPSVVFDSACSASLSALHYAILSLKSGDCDYAIVGGARLFIFPPTKDFLKLAPVASPTEAVRAFDKNADGTVGGEGGGVIILKKLGEAMSDRDNIHAVIKGSGINSNGARSNSLSSPSQVAQAELIKEVIEKSGIEPESLSYIEAHGTGTKLGDPIEIEGINMAFFGYSYQKNTIPLGTLKENIGHLDSAAGIASIIKILLCFKHKQIPPSINFATPNPFIDFENTPVYIPTQAIAWNTQKPKLAAVSSLGLTGSNGYVLLAEAPLFNPPVLLPATKYIFTLSANHQDSLRKSAFQLQNFLQKNKQVRLGDVSYTLNTGRKHHYYKVAVIANSHDELISALDTYLKNQDKEGIIFTNPPNYAVKFKVIFLLADIPVQNLALDLLDHRKLFSEHYHHLFNQCGRELSAAQFAAFYSYYQLLLSYGIVPQVTIGMGKTNYIKDYIYNGNSLEQNYTLFKNHQNDAIPDDRKVKLHKVLESLLEEENDCSGNSPGWEHFRDPQKTKGSRLIFVSFFDHGWIKEIVNSLANPPESFMYLDFQADNLYQNIGYLYCNHYPIQWENVADRNDCYKVSLPTYVYQKKSYFLFEKRSLLQDYYDTNYLEDGKKAENKVSKAVSCEEVGSIIRKVLKQDPDVNLSFSQNGGNSIDILQIIAMLNHQWEVVIDTEIFYTHSTVGSLIQAIFEQIQRKTVHPTHSRKKDEASGSLAATKILATVNDLGNKPPEGGNGNPGGNVRGEAILLTGATGFLGVHLLAKLIEDTAANVFCLIRCDNQEHGKARLREWLNYYFNSQLSDLIEQRIFIIKGDISAENLGIEAKEYTQLGNQIDTVIHSAADVRHYGNYLEFQMTNVDGCNNMIRFCLSQQKKRYHHISTLAVSGSVDRNCTFGEDDLDIGQDFSNLYYSKSKFEAEKLVMDASGKGLDVSIYRMGNIVGRYRDGVFQKNIGSNSFYNFLKAILVLQKAPELSAPLSISPVDLCSQAIVKLLPLKNKDKNIFHVMNQVMVTMDALVDNLNRIGFHIRQINPDDFREELFRVMDLEPKNQGISLVYHELLHSGKGKKPVVSFDSSYTNGMLNQAGFRWNELNSDFLEKLIYKNKEFFGI